MDDTQLYIELSPNTLEIAVRETEDCVAALQLWFAQNGLDLNPDKSEAILLSTAGRAKSLSSLNTISAAGAKVCLADKVRLLGVTLDASLSLNIHVKYVCRAAFYHPRALWHIRPSLTEEMANSVACSLVQSRRDYANALYVGMSSANSDVLQRAQNTIARVMTLSLKRDHITTSLKRLHWLPVHQRVTYKIATLVYNIRRSREPDYLYSLLEDYTPTRQLRSTNTQRLCVPRTKLKTGKRAFGIAAPSVWNALQSEVTSTESLTTFRKLLKTRCGSLDRTCPHCPETYNGDGKILRRMGLQDLSQQDGHHPLH